MQTDDPEADLAALWAAARRTGSAVEARRKKEARGMPGRRPSGRETKTAQLNVKITPSLKARIGRAAVARGVSVSELIEAAFEAIEGAR